ncbi:chloride channel protein [Silvibacterium dinghuense]|uniref:Chloride channel protein n=1 Tax=Silvibacterium dinghuense TaxID=1560006 RepID=A0A4Q1SKG2_9BACT|nr:chloride channel protein [Silvibacterium dinghuense]
MFVQLLRWLVIASCAGVLGGSASALLLASLNLATAVRESHLWLIALLPLAGLFVGCLYKYLGSSVEAGNNLILEEVHDPQATIPLRMTPLILIGTFLTHLFGGSAGREGTAIQTGASLADQLTRLFRLRNGDRRILLMAGISAGFGSVFGTPLAGAVFGLEVLAIGRLNYAAIFPCFVGAFVGDFTTHAWRVHHTIYTVTQVAPLSPRNLLAACAAGIAFGVTAMLFAKATHAVSHFMKKHIAWGPARPFTGGIVVALAVAAVHTTRYIGLGVPTIVASFQHPLHWYDFAAKFAFTAVTLGSGFKGGEVTPLFYIGSTLGNALAHVLPLPTSLLAGMGFVAVFAGAANTPIASSLMAVELFGAEAGAFAAIACVVSYLFSGHSGIYHAQRLGSSKHAALTHEEGLSLALIAKQRTEADADTLLIPENERFPDSYPGGILMANTAVLRVYFSTAQVLKHDSWWRRMLPQNLGAYLLEQAREAGIEQALLHRVTGGYLKNQKLIMDSSDIPPLRLPQCLELVGEEDLLQEFLRRNQKHLGGARVMFLHGKEAEFEAELERQELEEAIAIERNDQLLP